MNNILDQLYKYLPRPSIPEPPAREELWATLHPMCNQVQEVFGLKFLDQFTLFQSQLDDQQDSLPFQQGFRLGAMLMLELFRSA